MRRVLIITYYWPPGAGAGVFRWLKFTRYLRHFGWEPVIYTPLNPESPVMDPSLEADIPGGVEVIRQPIWEPYDYYKRLTGRKPGEKIQTGFLSEHKKAGWGEKLATWIRGNFFIPDARKYWIKPSVGYLTHWIRVHQVDAIVSTGPPHSMHLIALGIKKNTGLPWLADFRDPWTQIDFYDQLMLTPWANKKHLRLEKNVLQTADQVVTVSASWASGLRERCNRDIQVITNGYDPDDFRSLPAFEHGDFSITHLGTMNADRNPEVLWPVLAELVKTDVFFSTQLKIQLIGKTDIRARESIRDHGLDAYTSIISHLPHREALSLAARSAVLLLPLNNTPNVSGITPGKLYEYMALQRPVLCIGPANGDAARIIRDSVMGLVAGFEDASACKRALISWKEAFLNNQLHVRLQQIEPYSRKNLTGEMAQLLNLMTQKGKK